MILMRDDVTLLAGVSEPDPDPWPPFEPRVMHFLEDLSLELQQVPAEQRRESAAAFGFWCRRSRLEMLETRHASPVSRLGRGTVFHLAPSNVPALFAYTLAIGLLAGNSNIVRLSSRRAEEEENLLGVLSRVMSRPEHEEVKRRISLISYDRNRAITAEYCAGCDALVVWGGDATVAAMREMPLAPHARMISFPDRWSLAVISQAAFTEMRDEERERMAHLAFNDIFQMDQNACSSPQMTLWLEDGGDPECHSIWWEALAGEAAEQYPIGAYQAARKLEKVCRYAMTMTDPPIQSVRRYQGNTLFVARMEVPPAKPEQLRGEFGLMFESTISSLEELLPLLSPKVQTLVCGGLNCREVTRFLAEHHARGIDRVIPFGQALEMDPIWDGKDLIAELSRMIC